MKKKRKSLEKLISLIGIKYYPSLAAISCSAKIWLLCNSEATKDNFLYAVNWINCVLSAITLYVVYCLGVTFGYCWKHRSLCRIAWWGYAWYAWFLIIKVSKEDVLNTATLYVTVVLIITVFYRED